MMRNIVRFVQEKRREHAEKTFSNGKCQKSRDQSPNPEEETRGLFSSFNEYKFLICLICFSSAIVFCKVPIVYEYILRRVLCGSITAFSATWSVCVELRWLFVPAIAGIVTTLYTWRTVFLNSRIPGVDPPYPVLPRIEISIRPSSISSSYLFAIEIGICVFVALLILEFISL